jgi:hypothetical protein
MYVAIVVRRTCAMRSCCVSNEDARPAHALEANNRRAADTFQRFIARLTLIAGNYAWVLPRTSNLVRAAKSQVASSFGLEISNPTSPAVADADKPQPSGLLAMAAATPPRLDSELGTEMAKSAQPRTIAGFLAAKRGWVKRRPIQPRHLIICPAAAPPGTTAG